MKQSIFATLLILFGIGLLGCQKTAPEQTTAIRKDIIEETFPEEQANIKRLMDEALDVARKKDLNQLELFHLYGPKFSKFDSWEPLTRQDAEAGRKAEQDAFAPSNEIVALTYEDLKVDVFGDVAIATFYLPYSIKVGKEVISGNDRMTLVWVRVGDSWKITHEHGSPLKSR